MKKLIAVFLALMFLGSIASAQRIILDGGGGDPPPPPPPPPPVTCPGSTSSNGVINTSYGYHQWQVDQLGSVTTFTSESGFSTPPGYVTVPVTLACAVTIHEIHGNFSFGVFQGGTCGTGSIIAQVLDQNGNALTSLDVIQFGQSSVNLSVKGSFATPLSVTGLRMAFFVNQCGAQVASWSLSMS